MSVTTFTEQISRYKATQLGEQAVQIGNHGFYTSPSGTRVDITGAVHVATSGTIEYAPGHEPAVPASPDHDTEFEVTNETTLSAGRRLQEDGLDVGLMNFASAHEPGGGFLCGARAQEEYLARSSALWHCIKDCKIYPYHHANPGHLYADYVIHSPDVPVFRGDDHELLEVPETFGMITAAACMANRISTLERDQIVPVMRTRMRKVLSVAAAHGHHGLVLGAWGCGAFGNDGIVIAQMFWDELNGDFAGYFRRVIFAIVDWSEERKFIGPFERVVSQ